MLNVKFNLTLLVTYALKSILSQDGLIDQLLIQALWMKELNYQVLKDLCSYLDIFILSNSL